MALENFFGDCCGESGVGEGLNVGGGDVSLDVSGGSDGNVSGDGGSGGSGGGGDGKRF